VVGFIGGIVYGDDTACFKNAHGSYKKAYVHPVFGDRADHVFYWDDNCEEF
jgi:hypothetical protein